jgi:hypothetical protein
LSGSAVALPRPEKTEESGNGLKAGCFTDGGGEGLEFSVADPDKFAYIKMIRLWRHAGWFAEKAMTEDRWDEPICFFNVSCRTKRDILKQRVPRFLADARNDNQLNATWYKIGIE